MATCSFKGCKKKEFKDGLCSVHMKKLPTAEAVVYSMVLGRAQGAVSVNETFAAKAALDTSNDPYKQRIEYLRSDGPSSGGEELVHGISCLHDTQKANNVTVWFSWNQNTITIWGLGSHSGGSGAGNDKYTMTWFDGTSKNWTRKKKKK